MGVHHSSSLIIGISLQEFFIKVGEKVETFDEFDRKGNKTGKKFTEKKLLATLPDGNEVVIGEMVKDKWSSLDFQYDFYSSLGFNGSESDQTFLKLHYVDFTNNLSNYIIGVNFESTDGDVEKIDFSKLNETILNVRDELKEKFSYNGIVNIYLMHNAG
jgi:hypothetical protein